MVTPEGRIKAEVNKQIKPFEESGEVWRFMPVQTGFGKKALDYILCVAGIFVSIETKAPGKTLTPLQQATVREIHAAGGGVFEIDTIEKARLLGPHLQEIINNVKRAYVPKA